MTDSNKSPKKSIVKDVLMVAVIMALAALNVFQYTQNQSCQEENDKLFKLKEKEIRETYTRMDSISSQLDDKIAEIKELGGDVDSLIIIKNQLEKEKRQLKNAKNAAQKDLTALKGKLVAYEALLKEKDKEIVRLKDVNQSLLDETIDLKNKKNELTKELNYLKEREGNLNEKVKAASALKVRGLNYVAVSERGRERIGKEFRVKQLSKLKLKLKLDDNPLAEIGNKKIVLRINDPDGSTMFNPALGSSTFTYQGEKLFYTMKQDILYDNSQQTVEFLYDYGSLYKKGVHSVELYCEGALIHQDTFIVK